MNTDKVQSDNAIYPEADLSEKILGAAFTVHNTLGVGFLEKVYENALAHELRRAGISIEQQKPVQVRYNGTVVGDYQADLIVDARVLVECKAVSGFDLLTKRRS